jgi:hypothetical protein
MTFLWRLALRIMYCSGYIHEALRRNQALRAEYDAWEKEQKRKKAAKGIDADAEGTKENRSKAEMQPAVEANVQNAIFVGAKLRGVDCQGANMNESVLRVADLSGACLVGTSLRHAELEGADLTDANVEEADFTGANLFGARLDDTFGENVHGIDDVRRNESDDPEDEQVDDPEEADPFDLEDKQ